MLLSADRNLGRLAIFMENNRRLMFEPYTIYAYHYRDFVGLLKYQDQNNLELYNFLMNELQALEVMAQPTLEFKETAFRLSNGIEHALSAFVLYAQEGLNLKTRKKTLEAFENILDEKSNIGRLLRHKGTLESYNVALLSAYRKQAIDCFAILESVQGGK